jgi:hypothetical protein
MLAPFAESGQRGGRTMSDEKPGPDYGKGGYGSKWKKYLAWYLIIGGVAYLLIWLIFIRDGGFY